MLTATLVIATAAGSALAQVHAGPERVYDAVVHGNTDLWGVGDSHSIYAEDRGEEGKIRQFGPDKWCGRGWSGARESAASGCRILANPIDTVPLNMRMEWPTNDTDAACNWQPRDYLEARIIRDMDDTAYLARFLAAYDFEDYDGQDIYVGNRVRGWTIHRASAASERLPWYQLGFFAHGVPGEIIPVEIGLGTGLERSPAVECDHYVVGSSEALELRPLAPIGTDETSSVYQFGGAVMHCIEQDGTRSPGLVTGACARGGMDGDEWLTMADTQLWAEWFAAVTTNPDDTVIMVMLGHNTENHGTFEDNYIELLGDLRDGYVLGVGEAPMFLLVAPWAHEYQANAMTEERALFVLGLAGSNTAYGDVAAISLWHYFGRRTPPGMEQNLHCKSDAHLDMVYGAIWSEIVAGSNGVASSPSASWQGTQGSHKRRR